MLGGLLEFANHFLLEYVEELENFQNLKPVWKYILWKISFKKYFTSLYVKHIDFKTCGVYYTYFSISVKVV